jgi:hypothetical protein
MVAGRRSLEKACGKPQITKKLHTIKIGHWNTGYQSKS